MGTRFKMKIALCFLITAVVVHAELKRDCSWMKKRLNDNNTKRPFVYVDKEEASITTIFDYPKDLETLVNHQIRKEMYAFYNYLSMSQFFHREDHYLEGFQKFFHEAAMEELKHAQMFMKYQAKRGGRVELMDLPAPRKQEWLNAYQVIKSAIELEKNVTTEVLCLHQLGNNDYQDVDFVNFVEGEIIPEQYSSMKDLTNRLMTLKRMASGRANTKNDFSNYGIAEAMFDKKLKE